MTSHNKACHYTVRTAAGSKIIHYHFDSEHKWKSLFLILVIARISLQNTNLYLAVERSGLGPKLNVIKFQV